MPAQSGFESWQSGAGQTALLLFQQGLPRSYAAVGMCKEPADTWELLWGLCWACNRHGVQMVWVWA